MYSDSSRSTADRSSCMRTTSLHASRSAIISRAASSAEACFPAAKLGAADRELQHTYTENCMMRSSGASGAKAMARLYVSNMLSRTCVSQWWSVAAR